MEQNTTSQAAQKQGVKKKKSIKQKLLAFLKLAAPYLILCIIYGALMLIFGPKESNGMELSIDVGTITLPGIGAVSWSVFVGGAVGFFGISSKISAGQALLNRSAAYNGTKRGDNHVLSQWQQRLLLPVDHPHCDLGVLLLRQRRLGRV